MLTYQEIINEADERYPNALTPESKLRKIYNREIILCRTIYRVKTATVFDIVKGQFLYPLYFHHSKIISAIVNGRQYDYEEITNEQSSPPYLYTYENSLGMYPTPEQDSPGGLLIYHYMEPQKGNINAYPAFDNDFPMVLVYGLCVDLAEISHDGDSVNNFTSKYNGEVDEFKKAQREPDLPPMRVE